MSTSPDAPALPSDVVVLAGDAAESSEAFAALRQSLWDWHQPVGPVEEDLVDRIAQLRWRLQRVAVAERGAIGERAFDTRDKRNESRKSAAVHLRQLRPYEGTPLGPEHNPVLVRSALASIHLLEFALRCGGIPSEDDVNRALTPFYGTDEFGRPMGEGLSIAGCFEFLREDAADPSLSEAQRKARVRKGRAEASRALARAEVACAAVHAQAEARAHAHDDALVDARRTLPADVVRGVVGYERHLQMALDRTTRELERVVARRRLAGVGLRAGVGRLR